MEIGMVKSKGSSDLKKGSYRFFKTEIRVRNKKAGFGGPFIGDYLVGY